MIFGFFPEPVIPGEAVTNYKATQDVVRAEYANNTKCKER
jgi:hypothetical protein